MRKISSVLFFVLLVGVGFTQKAMWPSSWYSAHLKSISFLSDSLAIIESGYFPEAGECDSLMGLRHIICTEQSQKNGFYTQKEPVFYQFQPTYLLLSRSPQLDSSTAVRLPVRWLNDQQFELTLNQPSFWFPHQNTTATESTLVFTKRKKELFTSRWDSLLFNQLKVFPDGSYQLAIDHKNVKKGTLQKQVFNSIDSLIRSSPFFTKVLPEENQFHDVKNAFRSYSTPVPADASSFNFQFYAGNFMIQLGGYASSYPAVISDVFDSLNRVETLQNTFLIFTQNHQRIDVEDQNCLFWYLGKPIQHAEIPYDWAQWAGKVQRKVFVVASDTVLHQQHFDYVFFVSPEKHNEISIGSDGKPFTTHYGTKSHRKQVLREIHRYFKRKKRE